MFGALVVCFSGFCPFPHDSRDRDGAKKQSGYPSLFEVFKLMEKVDGCYPLQSNWLLWSQLFMDN